MKSSGISEQLKSTIVRAFARQRDFARQFEVSFPVIQDRFIHLANVQAGITISVENLAALSHDFQTVIESLRSLTEKGEVATTEVNMAMMQLKEFEDDPKNITEDLVDAATVLANADIWMQSSKEFVWRTIEMALPKVRREAVRDLSADRLRAWADDIAEELERRNLDRSSDVE